MLQFFGKITKSIIDVLPDDYTFNDQCNKIIASLVLI